MKFRRHMALEHGLTEIELTPLIDMVFLLLIFFLLTSNFIVQPGIKVNLPKAATSEIVQVENIEIVISGENVTYLNGKVVTTNDLKLLIKQVAKRKQSILIKSDRRAALGRVVEVWDMCRDLGVSQVNIATNQE
jgi:biopolymer transport protein ExbD